jgi:TonB family protein
VGFDHLVGGKLGAALGASVLLHAGLLGSLEHLIGGTPPGNGTRAEAALRARIVTLADSAPFPAPAAAPERPATRRRASELAAAQALPLLPGPQYFSAAELDQRPLALSNITLDYPAGVKPREVMVVARILINEDGRADGVQILSSADESGFDRIVTQAFGNATYRPGRRNNRPVKSQITVEVKFVPEPEPQAGAEAER